MQVANKKGYFIGLMLSALSLFGVQQASAQSPFKGLENLFTVPASYVVKQTATAPVIDGDIDETVWQQAQWTSDFIDIEGDLKPKPPLQTNVKMLWDDSCLYIAARLNDPQVWATLKEHDRIIFKDNDFELFIDPTNTTHNYYEIEVNASNAIFDLFLPKPYRDMGGPVSGWDAHNMRTAVKILGTLNNPADTDKGWTVEMAIPFKSIGMALNRNAPKPGTIWRINFSRVQYNTTIENGRNVKLKNEQGYDLPEHNWVWTAQGVINMHFPERWGYLQFAKDAADTTFVLPYSEEQRKYLWLVYYREKMWFQQHHKYATSLKKLGLKGSYNVLNKSNSLRLEATTSQFAAFINVKDDQETYTINQDGFTIVK
jgi:hypothetical protein